MAWTEELPPNKHGVVRHRGVYRLANGKTRSRAFDHKAAAKRWANAEEQKVADGSRHDPARGRMKWGTWCEQWWPTRRMEPGFARSQVSLRDQHVLPRWADVALNDIDHRDMQEWVNGLTPGLSASSACAAYYQLSSSLKAAVRAGLLTPTLCVSYGGDLAELDAFAGYAALKETCAGQGVEVFESPMSMTGMVNVGTGAITLGFAAAEHAFAV